MTVIKQKFVWITFLLLFTVFMIYAFWGPLFPWNPVKSNYLKVSSSKADIYISNMTNSDSVIFRMDTIMADEEDFHDLTYKHRIRIIIPPPEISSRRFMPWQRGNGFSVSLSAIRVIYIGSRARLSPDGIESYLKHELSHMLIDQNSTFSNTVIFHKQGWLVEGVAEYFSGHRFYSKYMVRDKLTHNFYDIWDLEKNVPQEMAWPELQLKYSFYGYFIEFLVDQYGLGKLQKFINRYIDDPVNYREIFSGIYSQDFQIIQQEFDTYLMR